MGYEAYSIDGGFVAYLKWKFTKYIEEDKDESSEDAADRVKEIERSIVKKFRSLYGERSHRRLMNMTLYRMVIR